MDTDDILALLCEVAEEFVTPRFCALGQGQIQEKSPGDLVTVADQEAEAAITARLRAAYPDAVILGEEAAATDPGLAAAYAQAEHAFTIDPVDGTKNFVHGKTDHAVMVAEVRSGRSVRAWIHQPQHQRSYVAEQGAGTWSGGQRLKCQPVTTDPAQFRAVSAARTWVGSRLGEVGPMNLSWVCCGVDYPHLIAGDVDALVYGGTRPWDHAPGTLMVTEAGGHVTTFDGEPYNPRRGGGGLLVTGGRAASDLVRPSTRSLPGF